MGHREFSMDRVRHEIPGFRGRLEALKQQLGSEALGWYPYDSLGAFGLLDGLLTGEHRSLSKLAGDEPVLDLGCGDGDVSFLCESFGHKAHALDYPPANYNGMRGVHALKSALGSSVEVFEQDFDQDFDLPDQTYGLALCLGVLYHLKSPYTFLERLAKSARYCILSTRIAQLPPDHSANLERLPVRTSWAPGRSTTTAQTTGSFPVRGSGASCNEQGGRCVTT